MSKFIAELKERRLGQTLVVYLGTGWVVIEALNFFIEKFELGKSLFNVIFILALCGLPVALLVGWFHGKPGIQRQDG